MKAVIFSISLALGLFVAAPIAQAADVFANCEQITTKSKTKSGRMIWKEKLAHFSSAGMVLERYFYPIVPSVRLFTEDGTLIEKAKLKTTGICSWHPECLFAATMKVKFSGKYYRNKFGSLYVRVTPGLANADSKTCRYYLIPDPAERIEYYKK